MIDQTIKLFYDSELIIVLMNRHAYIYIVKCIIQTNDNIQIMK